MFTSAIDSAPPMTAARFGVRLTDTARCEISDEKMEHGHRRRRVHELQSCTLAIMDEYVGNDWPGYSAPMPRHGHRWINILQKERGQTPMVDVAYVPTMCNHCDNAPCVAKGGGAVSETRRRHRAHRSSQGEGSPGPRRCLPLRPYLVERETEGSAGLAVRRPSARSGLEPDPRAALLSNRRHAGDQGRRRGDATYGARADSSKC